MKTRIAAVIAVLVSVSLGEKTQTNAGETVPPNMALIPAGTFQMGDAAGDAKLYNWWWELPVHSEFVSGFYIDKYEVTKALWDEIYLWATTHSYTFESDPQFQDDENGKAANHPVYYVSWYDAVKWCNARSEKEGRMPAYYTSATQTTIYRTGLIDIENPWVNWSAGYRLPTEAEWEKSAQGGTNNKRFPWGNTITQDRANYESDGQYSFDINLTKGYHPTYNDGVLPYTSPVGSFPANGYGLYDTSGNVFEWCWNWFESYGTYYSSSPGIDPRGATTGTQRVRRGGSWHQSSILCRTSNRSANYPQARDKDCGFRSILPWDFTSWVTDVFGNLPRPVKPTYGICPVKEDDKDSLIVVTHGWIPKEGGQTAPPNPDWVDEMTNSITTYLAVNGLDKWQVIAYKWPEKAWMTKSTMLSGVLLDNADKEGVNLGNSLTNRGWKHIHFIAHSAGAAVIQTASLLVKENDITTIIHTTFLDAYVGFIYNGRSKYGLASDWSDSYFSRDADTFDILAGLTGGHLDYSYNVDVTWLDTNKFQKGTYRSSWNGGIEKCYQTVTSHGWPYQFYSKTITGSLPEAETKGFGFLLSREGGGWDLAKSQYTNGNNPPLPLGTPDPTCMPDMALPLPDWNPFVDLLKPLIIKSTSGTSQVSANGVTLTTGSPVWFTALISTTNNINLISFDSQFLSKGAEGLLSVYWETNIISSIDERVVMQGLRHYTFGLPATQTNGVYSLGFRLDPFSDVTSSVMVTNVALGFVGVREPFSLAFIRTDTNSSPVFSLTGPSGYNYRVESSTNLVDWTTIAILINTSGVVNFSDPSTNNALARFYRTVVP